MSDRDPEVIKAEIDVARSQLAATVDTLAERTNPRRLADEAKARALEFVNQPAVKATLAGVAGLVVVVLVVRVRRRRALRSIPDLNIPN